MTTTPPEGTFTDADPFDLPGEDGHDDGTPLTEAELDDLIERERTGGAIITAGEDLLLASPERAREVTTAVHSGLLARLRQVAREAAKHRGTVGRPTASHLMHEAQVMSRAHEVLAELERTFGRLRRESAELLADAVDEHLGRKRAAVSTPDGGEVTVETKAPASKVSVVEEDLLDVLGTTLVVAAREDSAVFDVESYAIGARQGIAALRSLGTPAWKSTALTGLVSDLQRRGEADLAARLEQSFARVASGEPKTTLTIKYPDVSA